jgi:hypothetical protein
MGPRFMSRGERPGPIKGHRAPNVRSWPIAAPSLSRYGPPRSKCPLMAHRRALPFAVRATALQMSARGPSPRPPFAVRATALQMSAHGPSPRPPFHGAGSEFPKSRSLRSTESVDRTAEPGPVDDPLSRSMHVKAWFEINSATEQPKRNRNEGCGTPEFEGSHVVMLE